MSDWTNMPNYPAAGWRCAACGKLITGVEDGWVEWLASEDAHGNTRIQGLRLVHRLTNGARARGMGGCQYNSRQEFKRNQSVVEGLPLGRFVGPDGLMLLLSLIEEGVFDAREVLELTKRTQVPGYELARDLFPTAIARRLIEPSIGEGYYLQSEIQTLLRWATTKAG